MAKDRKKLLHIHSSVNDKQPTPETLAIGELAVNNAEGNAFISLKNSNGGVVRFSEDGTIVNWMDYKEVFPYKGYVRGENDNENGTLEESDLVNNKSNLIIRLNQVASANSDHGEEVNDAKDIYGNTIKEGEGGIAIDMSRYAMIDANPSFSSVTTTDHAEFNGATHVKGETFDVNVSGRLTEKGQDALMYGTASTTIGGDGTTTSSNITYYRNPKGSPCDISATTVDGALDEVLDRSKVKYSSITTTSDTAEKRSSYTTHTIYQDNGECDNKFSFQVNDTIVSMSSSTEDASSEILKKYTLWQYIGDEKKEIGVIDIPKDHILKDVAIVNGHWDGTTWTDCPNGDNTCTWYIKLTWNVFDPTSGHTNDKVTYIAANDLVQDYNFNNSNAVTFTVNYDGKKTQVGADLTVQIKNNNGNGTKTFEKGSGTHSLDSYKITCSSGDVRTNNAANWEYDPFEAAQTFKVPTDASLINRNTFTVSYGATSGKQAQTYDPGQGALNTARNSSLTIPSDVAHLNRGTLTFGSGSFAANSYDATSNKTVNVPTDIDHIAKRDLTVNFGIATGQTNTTYNGGTSRTITIPTAVSHLSRGTLTFDSGSFTPNTYDATVDQTVNIPTSFKHMSEFSNNCYTFANDICMANNTIAAKGFYASSDRNLKENIQVVPKGDYSKADQVAFKSFNFKDDDTKTKTYGVIAQDVQAAGLNEIVHTSESGSLNVDYISLLILKMASLENTVGQLKLRVSELEEKLKKNE